jgi:DNA invertase Pin-like site-specific DNA recombinase
MSITIAKERGVQFGRKNKLPPEQLAEFRREFENPPDGVSKADIAKKYGLSQATGYRICKV